MAKVFEGTDAWTVRRVIRRGLKMASKCDGRMKEEGNENGREGKGKSDF